MMHLFISLFAYIVIMSSSSKYVVRIRTSAFFLIVAIYQNATIVVSKKVSDNSTLVFIHIRSALICLRRCSALRNCPQASSIGFRLMFIDRDISHNITICCLGNGATYKKFFRAPSSIRMIAVLGMNCGMGNRFENAIFLSNETSSMKCSSS